MVSVWTSNPVIKVLSGIAVLFGIATSVSGGSALFELHGTQNSTAQIVPFVLYFNFAAGFAYIVTGAGLILKRRWAPVSAAGLFNALCFGLTERGDFSLFRSGSV